MRSRGDAHIFFTDDASAHHLQGMSDLTIAWPPRRTEARAAGFRRVGMMATPAGEPLYLACGYQEIERVLKMAEQGMPPGVRMGRRLSSEEFVRLSLLI